MASNVTVKVPQDDGEILVSYGGDAPITYKVSGGQTHVEERDLAKFLTAVEGSTAAPKPGASAKEGE